MIAKGVEIVRAAPSGERYSPGYAAVHDTTINALIRELLQEALTCQGRARAAADQLLALADQEPYFTTDPGSIRREELHERR